MSSAPNLKLFGRKYQLLVKFPADDQGNQKVINVSDSDFDKALRITFDVYTPAWQVFWYADITIWNLDQVTAQQILGVNTDTPSGVKQGMEVILSAGYQNGNYGVIFDGFVWQPLVDRENVVDLKITLHCLINLTSRNFINKTYATVNQQELIQKMAADCFYPIPVQAGSVSAKVNSQNLPRGKTVFGNPKKYVDWVAEDNNMQTWITSKGLNMAALDGDVSVSQDDLVVYTPNTGIIGTPIQTQLGCDFRVLLDPRIQAKKPLMQVKIDNTLIRQQKKQIGDFAPTLLDQDGQYIVIGTRYLGDTRGNDWYTDVTAVTSLNGRAALLNLIGTQISQ